MKSLILAVLFASVSCVIVPIYGQTSRENPKAGETKTSDTQPTKINTINVDSVTVSKFTVQQQSEPAGKPDNDKKESQSYLSRLIAPESLPNLILCAVGVAGVFVARFTLQHISRQTDILVDYTQATRDSADATAKSAAAVEKQAGLMESQLTEMRSASTQAGQQVAIAQRNIDIFIRKERAQLSLEVENLELPSHPEFWIPSVQYKIVLYGPTNAIIVQSGANATFEDSAEPPNSPFLSTLFIPGIITPSESPKKGYALIFGKSFTDIGKEIQAVKDKKQFVHFWGYIHYQDIFGEDHWTRFRRVWEYTDLAVFGKTGVDEKFGRWKTCGHPDENSEKPPNTPN